MRHSTGETLMRASLSPPNSEEKLLPHYLRASTSSCHDFCKYGRKHAFEAKGRCPIPRLSMGSLTTLDGQSQVKNVNLGGERKKKAVIKLKPKLEPHATPDEGQKKKEVIKLEPTLEPNATPDEGPKKKEVIKLEPTLEPNATPDEGQKKKEVIKLEPTLEPNATPDEGQKKKEVIKLEPTLEPNATPDEGQKAIKDVNLVERKMKKVIKLKPTHEKNTGLSDKPRTIKQKALSPGKKIDIHVKPVIASKLKPVAAKSLSPLSLSGGRSGRRNSENSPSNLSGSLSGGRNNPSNQFNRSGGVSDRRNSGGKLVNNVSLLKVGERKALKPPLASLSPKPIVNGVASLKPVKHRDVKAAFPMNNQNKVRKAEPNDEEIIEKTLYVIEPKPENKSLEPIQRETYKNRSRPSLSSSPSLSSHEDEDSDSNGTLSEADESVSEQDKIETKNQVEVSKGGDKWRLRSGIVHPEDKECVPQKLRFRRGKVVSLQSENNGTRRLKFRQGRVVGENQNGKVALGRRSFKRKEFVESNGTDPKAQAVMLRHQDVQGKKEEKGLFNDVIEETANKLVGTRKSKVKALVGAFETVISLQESKPGTNS
ncbi:uncharacterized protein LOC143851276 [Tasmannia lanceolata]|uniref:uncharacterized protein LOC143851276 n=1 Tax=Tasmannia lanceolata TaxID=3420 RepID=UPI004063E019